MQSANFPKLLSAFLIFWHEERPNNGFISTTAAPSPPSTSFAKLLVIFRGIEQLLSPPSSRPAWPWFCLPTRVPALPAILLLGVGRKAASHFLAAPGRADRPAAAPNYRRRRVQSVGTASIRGPSLSGTGMKMEACDWCGRSARRRQSGGRQPRAYPPGPPPAARSP